jgi:hypothetical protein
MRINAMIDDVQECMYSSICERMYFDLMNNEVD